MGNLPLYQDAQGKGQYTLQANAGLYFDKFCDAWQGYGETWSLGTNKQAWLNSFASKGSVGNRELLAEKTERFKNMIGCIQGRLLFVKNRERFITGMGGNHPVENGFAWEHSLGVPYLAGSSLKGLVRAWATSWAEADEGDIERIFCPATQDKEQAAVGSVIFFAMLPTEPVKLATDIMTPHYSEYYQNDAKGNKAPADWYSPNPIAFLTVDTNQSFVIGIAPRCSNNLQHKADVELVQGWLLEALEIMGAGAKTAIGYGRFVENKVKQLEWKKMIDHQAKQEKISVMSPLEREMEEDGYSEEQTQRFKDKMNDWLAKMASADNTDKVLIAQKLEKWYQKNESQEWEKPKIASKKNQVKINAIKAVLQEAGV